MAMFYVKSIVIQINGHGYGSGQINNEYKIAMHFFIFHLLDTDDNKMSL